MSWFCEGPSVWPLTSERIYVRCCLEYWRAYEASLITALFILLLIIFAKLLFRFTNFRSLSPFLHKSQHAPHCWLFCIASTSHGPTPAPCQVLPVVHCSPMLCSSMPTLAARPMRWELHFLPHPSCFCFFLLSMRRNIPKMSWIQTVGFCDPTGREHQHFILVFTSSTETYVKTHV